MPVMGTIGDGLEIPPLVGRLQDVEEDFTRAKVVDSWKSCPASYTWREGPRAI